MFICLAFAGLWRCCGGSGAAPPSQPPIPKSSAG